MPNNKHQYEGKHPGPQAHTPKNTGRVHKPDTIKGAANVNKDKRTEKNGA